MSDDDETTEDAAEDMHKSIASPLQGLNVNFTNAKNLASAMDEISGDVRLVNFAYVKLKTNSPLGEGSFSKVFRYVFADYYFVIVSEENIKIKNAQ